MKIAIIGIGCRLPGGAGDHRSFWRNLMAGRDCIVATPADRYSVATLGSRDGAKPGRLVGGRGGYIDGFDEFDPGFFGISPREAEHMDPQQRKLLEVTWDALEDGGQKPARLAGRDVGVYIGAFTLDYKIVQFADLSFDTLAAHTATGTMMTMVSNRISYCFDFRGPSMSIDTACSSSLVAVHLACESLGRGETSLALAGGTLLHMTPQYTIAETKGGFLSPDGRSRTFDATANGYVRAEGVAVVALKRLDDAMRDGDPIHAVIIGTGVNQDGRTNGITVPNPDAQVELITKVCADAGITPGDLQYIEAHGTSTPVGDPIEANALGRALRIGRRRGSKCYIGSVKTNIGHTEAAAGIAGLIKTALSLRHRTIPPHINLEQVNPEIDMSSMPYEIPTEVTAWPAHDGPARAGVNSFGFGGTNAHVLLQEAPDRPARPDTAAPGRPHSILALTARDPAELAGIAASVRHELSGVDGEDGEPPALRDVGFTFARRRQHHDSRLSIVYSSAAGLDERLECYLRGEAHPHVLQDQRRPAGQRRLVWVFTGMGPQWWAMGRQLFASEPVYREAIEACDREIQAQAGWSLVDALHADEAGSQMAETWLAQPANFALQIGLAALWRSYGVRPDAIVGHSTGEIAAFYEAGVYSLADAVTVVVHRSRLQQRLVGTGTMLAVSLPEAEIAKRAEEYDDRISLAAINSPAGVTLAGDEDALVDLAERLQAEDVFAKLLTVRVPYHSARMDLIKDELLSSLSGLTPRSTRVPLYLTGREGLAAGAELDADYWWDNVRCSVRFRSAIDRIIDDGYGLFLEIGPHPVLARAIQECLDDRGAEGRTVASIRRQEDEPARFTASLATLHNLGVDIAWDVLYPSGDPVPLPRYPFKRDRYWVEPRAVAQIRLGRLDHPLLGRRLSGVEPTWEVRLDLETLPYLNDHRIQDNVVFPAAGYLEMAMQAVWAMTGGTRASLTDIRLRRALFLSDTAATTVQLSFSSGDSTFTVATVPPDDAEPTVHATGVVQSGQGRRLDDALDAEAIRARAVRHLDGAACYAGLAELGYHYGPAFQAIEDVWIGPGEALARIRPPAPVGDAAGHHIHPVLLDACFQALLTPQLLADEPRGGMRLPVSIEDVRIDRVGDQPLWVHARVTGEDDLLGDITVYADDGAPLGVVTGFRATDVERASAAVGQGTIDGWLVEPTWVDHPLPADEPEPEIPREWLILADRQGIGEELATLASAAGGRCRLIHAGSEVSDGDVAGADMIVHLWNLDAPPLDAVSGSALRAHAGPGAYSLVELARAMQSTSDSGRLFIVTRGTQPVLADDPVEPVGASAWGIGRVLWQQELPACPGRLIDLDPRGGDDAAALMREVCAEDTDEIALRGDRRYTIRLRPAASLTRPLPLRMRADGHYLVTGAFGALGRLLCHMLVRRGARRLILVSRTPLPGRDRWGDTDADTPVGRNVRFIEELERLGAQPVLAPVDVTDEQGLTAWLAEHRRRDPLPIRGVFHLAGRVHDTLVAEMDRPVFDDAFGPKVIGGYLLHRLLRDEPVEHFVLFSSVASLLTTAGQTNYAAGNAFLDALAHHRRAHRLPGLSINWGPWATGMISELGLIEHYRYSRGMSSLSPEAGIAVLERVIGQDLAQLLVATVVDWPAFLAWYPSPPPLVTELATAGTTLTDDSTFLEAFREGDADKRRLLVTERFSAIAATVLRVPADELDAGTALSLLGLDSLLAMELRARVNAELDVALPVVTLLSGATVDDLVTLLHDGLLDRAGAGDAVDDDFAEHTDEHEYPLTQNQKALWFLKQLNPEGFAYNIGGAVEVRTALDPELMFEAFRTLIARHPSLRANFLMAGGQPVQQISAGARADHALLEVRDTPWGEIYQTIIDEYRKPYDLERDPLIRLRLLRRGDDRWIIMKAVHHIISDAVSTFTFIEELLAIYDGLRLGRPASLPAVPARYLDFLNWQNRFLAGAEAQRMLDYWRAHLPAEVPTLQLPTDRARPPVQTNNGASEFFTLDAGLSARIHALGREHNVTPFMVLLCAYYLLLQRYSGQDDIIVGSPVTGRTREEFGAVYGYFVNPLPLYVDLAGEPSIAELLARVRATVLGGLDNQEYPFVLLVDKLGLAHDPSRSAVFQAMFILLSHKVATEKYGYKLEYIELPEEEGQFDLTLSAYYEEADERFHCVLKYNTDLFLPETVRRMASHYVNLLEGLTEASPTTPSTSLELLAGAERDLILNEWSGTKRRIAAFEPVHELIGRVAAAHPDAIAVCMPATGHAEQHTERLTYGELDRRSGAAARRLRDLGVRDGSVVAVCMDKSPELIVALLAVLRAGGAYLPLDPGYPPDRLADMAERAGAVLAVVDSTAQELAGAVPMADLLASDVDALHCPIDLDAPAYVIYTSGSTGQPKAVQVSHRSLAGAYAAWRAEYRLDHDVRVHLQLANFSFDVFTGDLVRALCSGGTLVLIDRELMFDTARLYNTMLAQRVDCGEFVPAIVRGLMNHCARDVLRLDFMRLLAVGSDTWKVEEHERLRALCGPATRVVNSYGLTEATIDSAYFEGAAGGPDPNRMVPIGRPLPNSELYILDGRGRAVPAGVPGELCIGGAGVATGYVGDAEQTAARFVTLAQDSRQVRVYRSGDLACWDAEGGVRLLGRIDNQVKVRGHRIEAGEIEARLATWPVIADAVVTVREDASGESVLCAYCVPVPGAELDLPALRAHLAEYLPTFMIPAYLVALPALPLTRSGKVDTGALPPPRFDAGAREYEPPVTLYEARMAEHWKALLGLEEVGLRHDFFEAGGSSIKLIELIYHLQAEFNVTIPVSHLFKTTTLHGMATTLQHIITGRLEGAQPYLSFNNDGGRDVFCFPPAGGHGLVYRQLAAHVPELRIVAFNYLAGDDKVARYADLVMSLASDEPIVLFGYSLGGNLAFELAKELEGRGRTVSRVLIMDSLRITEPYTPTEEHLAAFARELREHLHRHTGSETVAAETLVQAREYVEFCGRTPNAGAVTAELTVISNEENPALYAAGAEGSWHKGSIVGTTVERGAGTHAEMLDGQHVARNAALIRKILTGAGRRDG